MVSNKKVNATITLKISDAGVFVAINLSVTVVMIFGCVRGAHCSVERVNSKQHFYKRQEVVMGAVQRNISLRNSIE